VGFTFGTDRDVYAALGYKRTLTYDDLLGRYVRQDIARRIVDAPPAATWQQHPKVIEEDDEEETEFEKQFRLLAERLKLYHYMERADKLAGIGRYGVLFIGVKGSVNFEAAVPKVSSPDDVLYLSAYSEQNAKLKSIVDDEKDVRFGLPNIYDINFIRDVSGVSQKSAAQPTKVHHSRVVHVAEGLLEDEIFGKPRLESPFNLLDDLQKVVGGSGEMFWQGAYRGFQADVDKEMELDPDDASDLSDEIDEFVHGLRRWVRTKGVTLNAMESSIADPRGAFSVVMSLISGTTGIPQRILMGSERGQLASSQDERNWNSRVRERQKSFAEVQILRPFIDRMISINALPSADYKIVWPDLTALGEEAKADVASKNADAIKKLSEQGAVPIITPEEARKKWFDLPAAGAPEPLPSPSEPLPLPLPDEPQ
jgi:hypothetical protein